MKTAENSQNNEELLRVKTGILVHSRRICTKIPTKSDSLTRRRPHTAEIRYEELVINTLLKAKNAGLAENTLKSISYSLKQISKNADLYNPSFMLNPKFSFKSTARQQLKIFQN